MMCQQPSEQDCRLPTCVTVYQASLFHVKKLLLLQNRRKLRGPPHRPEIRMDALEHVAAASEGHIGKARGSGQLDIPACMHLSVSLPTAARILQRESQASLFPQSLPSREEPEAWIQATVIERTVRRCFHKELVVPKASHFARACGPQTGASEK